MNSYAYVGNDPINGRDPTGEAGVNLNRLLAMGLIVRNRALANKIHPVSKIPFNGMGFPIFESVATKTVYLRERFTGTAEDFARANKRANLSETPKGFTWHHHEDGRTMQLVPTKIHAETGHTGGVATTKAEDLLNVVDPSVVAGFFSLGASLLLHSDGAPTDECSGGDLSCAYKGEYSEGAGPRDLDPDDLWVIPGQEDND
jgi:hypothetical protein